MRIENAIALVTGANRGIGRAIVAALLARGAKKVYATARNADTLAPVVALDPARVVALQLDVTDAGDLDAAAAAAGDITLLINNAGVLSSLNLFEGGVETARMDMEINYFGPLAAIRALSPMIAANGGGAVVNVLSVVSLASMPGLGGYSATKAAAHSLTQSARTVLAGQNIRVHGVYPGPVDTDMAKGFEMDKASPESVAENILSGVEADLDEIYPDPMAEQVGRAWGNHPKQVERMFAAY